MIIECIIMSTVQRTYSKRSTPSKQDLPCCRACLATDGKLYNMQEYKLTDAFARVSGMSMKHDKLPQQVCAYCAAQVRRYAAFRAKCGRAQLCLLGGLMQNALTVEYVRSIDRVANKFTDLMLSGVNTTDIAPEERTPEHLDTDKNTSIDTNNGENTTINDENRTNNDKNTTNSDNCTEYIKYVYDSNVEFKEGIPEIDLEKNAGDVEVNPVEDIGGFIVKDIAEIVKKRRRRRIGSGKKTIDGAKKPIKDKNIGKIGKQKSQKPVNQEEITTLTEEDQLHDIGALKTSKASHNGEGGKDDNALDIGDDNAVNIDNAVDVDDDSQVGDVVIVKDVEEIMKMKSKPARKRIRSRKKNDGEKPERKKKKEKIVKEKKVPVFREERIYKTDSAEFESTYNVKIIVFTKEQQLSEIEARKNSSKYVSAAFHCEDCGKGYQVEGAFNNHRRRHDQSAGEHACPVCTVRFRRHYTLLLHRETHRAHVVCQECGFVSRSRAQAVNHYRGHQGKIYSCQYCDKTFRTGSNYLTHLRLRHFTEHVSCDMCGEVFVGPMGVRQHKSIIHAVYSSKERKCVDCGIEFLTLDALQQHWSSATAHQGLACRMCGLDLPSAELLQAHTAEHHPACEECGQTFLDHASCDTHYMRKHHAVPVPIPSRAARRQRPLPAKRVQRPRRYMCEYCGKMQSMKADKLPQQVCAYCAAQVRRYAAFRAKCGRAQLCLLGGLMQNALTMKYVRSIDRVANKFTDLILSGVNSTDIAPEEKTERLVDTDKIASIHTNNDENTTNNYKSTNNNDKHCTEYIKYVYDSTVEFKEGIPEIDLENNGDIDVSQVEDIGGFVVKDVAEIVKKRRRIVFKKKIIDDAKKPVKEKKTVKIGKEKPKKPVNRDEITDLDKLNSTLTEEEQLRDIDARKTSKAAHSGECGKDDNALDIDDDNAVDIDDDDNAVDIDDDNAADIDDDNAVDIDDDNAADIDDDNAVDIDVDNAVDIDDDNAVDIDDDNAADIDDDNAADIDDDSAVDIDDDNAVDIDDDNTVDDDNQVGDVVIVKDVEEIMKMKPKPARKRIRSRKKNDGEKPERKKNETKIVKEKNIFREEIVFRTDSAKFESTYNVKIIVFTKEQQLSEIEAQKKSSKYLSAAFHCEDCGKGYQSEGAFNNHRRKHDQSAGNHTCPVCTMRFRRHNRLRRHRETHRAHLVCRDCGFVSRSRTQAVNHYRVHQGKIYSCQYCDRTFRTCSSYLTHLRLRHLTEHVSCDICGEVFVGSVGVRQHKSIIHAVYSDKQRKCVDCGIEFLTLDALQQHWGSATAHQGLACRMCGLDLPSAELLQAHTAEHHPACEECRQTFLDRASFDTHHKRKHLAVPLPLPPRAARPPRPPHAHRARRPLRFMCEYCGKLQPSQAVLLEHRRRHENVKPYACADCPKSFFSVTQYKSHVRIHTGERPFECDHCSRAFTVKNNMERHILNIHLGKGERVPCEICKRVFTTASSMRLHVRTVHGGEPWPKRLRKRPRNVAFGGKDGQEKRGEEPEFDAGKDGDGKRGEEPGFDAGKDVEGKRGEEPEFHP